MSIRYNYLTKKQANIVYAAIKRGDLVASRKWINDMYNTVGDCTDSSLEMMNRVNMVVSFISRGQLDLAQAIIDGKDVCERFVVTSITNVLITEENAGEYLFNEIGDIVEVEDGEWRWIIY